MPSIPETLAAMELLSKVGVSDEALGRAVREWLGKANVDKDPAPVLATPLGQAPSPPSRPLPVPETSLSRPAPPPGKDLELAGGTLPLKVRFQDGSATNISIPAALLFRLAQKMGTEAAARQLARDLAKTAPPEVSNRSGWVVAQMSEKLNG